TDPPFNAAPGGADMSGPIQQAINSCAGVLYFPQGTYLACNLLVRCPNQVWQGAGKGATILQARSGCTNLIVLSATNGPAATWELTGMTLRSNTGSLNLVNEDGGAVQRGLIHDNAFELGTGTALGGSGPAGIAWSGGSALRIERNDFSSL